MLHCFSTPLPKIDTIMLQHPRMVVAGLYDGSVNDAAPPHCCSTPTWLSLLELQHPQIVVTVLYDGSVIVAASPHGGGWPV